MKNVLKNKGVIVFYVAVIAFCFIQMNRVEYLNNTVDNDKKISYNVEK